MPSKKWQKHVRSDPKSFRRGQRPIREVAPAILVVTEGVVTEPVYLDEVRRRIAAPTVELVPHGAGANDPRVLAERALALQAERQRKARKRELSITQAERFDQLWIAFDTDVVTTQKLNDGLAFAHSRGILVASSTPCIEFWLLLHLLRTTSPFEKCVNVIRRLEEVMRCGYSKNKKEALELIPPLVAHIQMAVEHAGWVRKYHLDAGTPSPANPSTEMDRLIQAIWLGASPAHQRLDR